MRAGFILTAGDPTGYVMADFLTRSIRQAMPGVDVVQFTDLKSPPVVGVDGVQRRPSAPLALFIADHWAQVEGDWLLVDTDVVVQRDVRPVFEQLRFDLAVATRDGTYAPGEEGSGFMRRMPYNCGVVYSRSRAGRAAILDSVSLMTAQDQAWLGIQLAVATMRPLVLYNTFNYPPRTPDDDHVPSAHVLHYKGPWRKQVLINRIYREVVCASGS